MPAGGRCGALGLEGRACALAETKEPEAKIARARLATEVAVKMGKDGPLERVLRRGLRVGGRKHGAGTGERRAENAPLGAAPL